MRGVTRRAWFLVLAGVPLAARPSLRDEVAIAGNAHSVQYAEWTKAMNAHRAPGTVDARVVEAWGPLPELWRRLEKAWRHWMLGS
jgi:hypothetical protein